MVSDGITDRVDVPSKNYGTTYTLSCWVKTTDVSGVAISGDSNTSYALHITGTKIYHYPFGGGYYNQSATVADGVWHHIAIARSGGDIEFYVDGSNIGTTSGAVGDMIVAAFFAYESGSYTMVGNLDEISFFSTQLNSTQIAALWNSGTPLDISAESNLVSYYRMGESAVFNANTEWELPNYLKKDYFSNLSMTFDGVDDYVDCGQLSALSGATEFTVSGWFKQTAIDQQEFLWATYTSVSNMISLYTWTDGNLYFDFRNGATTYGWFDYSTLVNSGEWFHCACVFDGTGAADADKFKIYINGTSATLSFFGTLPTSTNATQGDFLIGKSDGWSQTFTGAIDDFSVYDSAKSISEIATIYNSGIPKDESATANLVGYWRMGEGSYWNATNWQLPDYSKQALFSQKSFTFDGVDQYISVPSFTTSGNDLTLSFWFNAVNLSSGTSAFLWGDSNNYVTYNLNEVIYAKINGNTSILVANSGGVPQLFGLDNWHNLTITKSGSTVTWFVDGVSFSDLGTGGTGGFSMDTIGSATAGAYYFLDGSIDDVAIFDEVKAIGDIWDGSGAPIDLSAESGLVGYWTFDDATFSTNWTVPDNSSNSNNGTSANMDE